MITQLYALSFDFQVTNYLMARLTFVTVYLNNLTVIMFSFQFSVKLVYKIRGLLIKNMFFCVDTPQILNTFVYYLIKTSYNVSKKI